MGGAIARRLKTAGFDISVWDRTKSKAEALQVGPVVDSPAEAARNADVLITMVTGPQALRDVYFGPSGVFTAGADSTIVDMSTSVRPPRASWRLPPSSTVQSWSRPR